ncbi:MAG: response regulator transcription factor [Siphonobacter sp.]
MPVPRVLLVEDDEALGFVVKDNLEQEGYMVDLQVNGKSAKSAFNQKEYDVCLFDVMLPEMDGFTLAEYIRNQGNTVPILFLTAKSLEADRIRGFKLGGDDYLVKPFSIQELLLRMEAILRRLDRKPNAFIMQLGNYQFDRRNRRLSCGDFSTDLTSREADLLNLLAERTNELISREEILNRLWGKSDYFLGRSLDVFISRLRKYLQHDPTLRLASVHGTGFRLIQENA